MRVMGVPSYVTESSVSEAEVSCQAMLTNAIRSSPLALCDQLKVEVVVAIELELEASKTTEPAETKSYESPGK
jgi:hypothetical protein